MRTFAQLRAIIRTFSLNSQLSTPHSALGALPQPSSTNSQPLYMREINDLQRLRRAEAGRNGLARWIIRSQAVQYPVPGGISRTSDRLLPLSILVPSPALPSVASERRRVGPPRTARLWKAPSGRPMVAPGKDAYASATRGIVIQ